MCGQSDPTGRIAQRAASRAPKMCMGIAALGVGRREAFQYGLDGLTALPLLSVEEECSREISWIDGCMPRCLRLQPSTGPAARRLIGRSQRAC